MADNLQFHWYGKKWEAAIVDKAAPRALSRVSSWIVNDAKRDAPHFLGNLRNAVSFHLERAKDIASYIGFSEGHANAWKYAMAVERGRKPGKMPPLETMQRGGSLYVWVQRKLRIGMIGSTNIATRRTTWRHNPKTDESVIEGVAFAVGRKISKEGTPPRPFLLPAFTRHEPRLKFEMVKIMQDIVAKELQKP